MISSRCKIYGCRPVSLIILGMLGLLLCPRAYASSKPPAADTEDRPIYETSVVAPRSAAPSLPTERAKSVVTREDLQRRLPRSAPDALRYEPSVFVQQTAHSQGSAFIRGLTGQQTLLLFDGIRVNNSTYRQGPNQYFFTLDSQSIDNIEVVRGGASALFGTDALGGVIMALPVEPDLYRRPADRQQSNFEPTLRFRGGTADSEVGGRVQMDVAVSEQIGFLMGFGARQVGLLEAGGLVGTKAARHEKTPVFEADNRTQLGTGFDELTADARFVYRPSATQTFHLATYIYRLYNGPRTDKCPHPHAPTSECLEYDEQFRTLTYGKWWAQPGWAGLNRMSATVSWQQQHERATLDRSSSLAQNKGRDTLNAYGFAVNAQTSSWKPASWMRLRADYGFDTYLDRVRSDVWTVLLYPHRTIIVQSSRGKYLTGSRYLQGGFHLNGKVRLWDALTLRAGGRVSWAQAKAPKDVASDTVRVNRLWWPRAGSVGIEWHAMPRVHVHANMDRSFRAPNLDDLTARQITAQGFQFENPNLTPETATTYELGLRTLGRFRLDMWVYQTVIDGFIRRVSREDTLCPEGDTECGNAWYRLQLENVARPAKVVGFEASAFAALSRFLTAKATVAWAKGKMPNPTPYVPAQAAPYKKNVPMSRIPPLFGTVELVGKHVSGLTVSAGLKWAGKQDRLAPADETDVRILNGGTPGFVTVDIRVSYRLDRRLFASIALENVFDEAYRYHGSSVNGAGRGLVFLLDVGPSWHL